MKKERGYFLNYSLTASSGMTLAEARKQAVKASRIMGPGLIVTVAKTICAYTQIEVQAPRRKK